VENVAKYKHEVSFNGTVLYIMGHYGRKNVGQNNIYKCKATSYVKIMNENMIREVEHMSIWQKRLS